MKQKAIYASRTKLRVPRWAGRVQRERSVTTQSHQPLASRTINSWEQEAEKAADSFGRGMRAYSRSFTPAPPAGFAAPQSHNESLPNSLRENLEEHFNADLSAVRIHRDGAAQSAAESNEAAAFTSGNHVYFGSEKYQPDHPSGQRLIAHEVVHVLQQAGRINSEGQLEVRPVSGSAEIQRFENFQRSRRKYIANMKLMRE